MNTLVFILICYGACNNMIFGSIFEGFRTFLERFGTGPNSLHKLFTCFMCLGTWMGMVVSAILIYSSNTTPINIENHALNIFMHGLLAAGGVWLLHTIQEAAERAFAQKS